MRKITSWFKSQDSLGSFATFNYRGENGYGTVTGGICSLIVTFISAGFIFLQLYGFFTEASYNQAVTTYYFSDDAGTHDGYTMQPGDYLATFLIKTTDPDTKAISCNDD